MPKLPPNAWKINEGVIIGLGGKQAILASQWEFEAFELEFDWRATHDDYGADFFIHADRLLDAAPIRIKKDWTADHKRMIAAKVNIMPVPMV